MVPETASAAPLIWSLVASTTDCTLDSAPPLADSALAWASLTAESPVSIADLVASTTVERVEEGEGQAEQRRARSFVWEIQ